MKELHFKRTAHPPFSHDIAPSDFFLFGWLKGELAPRSIGEISELLETVEETLDTFPTETAAKVFRTGSKD
jgi:hypothetical protein